MEQSDKLKPSIVDRKSLPEKYPTHLHSAKFWEQLGRTIATYGLLEEVLGRAIFAFTGTRRYSNDEVDDVYRDWLAQLERALTDALWNLIESYGKAVRDNPDSKFDNINDFVDVMKKAAVWRNALCHGSWRTPDKNGASIPFFVNRQGEVFETPVDIRTLEQIQAEVAEIITDVVDSVTRMGWKFPDGGGLGVPILS